MILMDQISYSIGGKSILQQINTSFLPGVFNMIIGPNGSGKTSLLKVVSGSIIPPKGVVKYNGIDMHSIPKIDLAKYRAVLSQHLDISFPLTVSEVILLGRTPHYNMLPNKLDYSILQEVLMLLDLIHFKERNYNSLSGGEKQRVQFARILAQIWEAPKEGEYRVLLMDEPLNNLDIHFQIQFLEIAKSLLNEQTILIGVIHDINLAVRYADYLYCLQHGKLILEGVPNQILDTNLIKTLFGLDSDIIHHPSSGIPIIHFK
jgi:iron complex transport system ATP-binding protein